MSAKKDIAVRQSPDWGMADEAMSSVNPGALFKQPDSSAKVLTAEQVKQRFESEGKTVAAWARANGYGRMHVYQLLNGTIKGKYGVAHEIAVKLGMKAPV